MRVLTSKLLNTVMDFLDRDRGGLTPSQKFGIHLKFVIVDPPSPNRSIGYVEEASTSLDLKSGEIGVKVHQSGEFRGLVYKFDG
ncbi:MAG: hypothetical protein AAGA60_32105 [Cyanobacteria bacterium P01_E01_bin.42]